MFNIRFSHVLHEQGTDEWLKWRSDGIGASEVVVLAGTCEYKTRYQLYLEKMGLIEPADLNRNPHIIRGHRCEPRVRDYLINHFNNKIDVLCGEDANHPHRKVSFDGVMLVVHDKQTKAVPVEIKSPCASVFQTVVDHLEKSETYQHHIWQVQYQMAMLDAPFGYLAFYCEVTNRIKLFTVYPDVEMQTEAIRLVDDFFYNHIEKEIEPAMDPDRDVFVLGDDLKYKWYGMANELLRIKEREAELKKEMDSLKTKSEKLSTHLIALTTGFKKVRAGNINVTRVKRKASFNYKKFLEDKKIPITEDDLNKYTQKSSISHRISIYDKDLLKANSQLMQKNSSLLTLADITKAVSLTL